MIEIYSKEDFTRQLSGTIVKITKDNSTNPPFWYFLDQLDSGGREISGSVLENNTWTNKSITPHEYSLEFVTPERGLYNLKSKLAKAQAVLIEYVISRQYYKGFNKHRIKFGNLQDAIVTNGVLNQNFSFEPVAVMSLFNPEYYSFEGALELLLDSGDGSVSCAMSLEFGLARSPKFVQAPSMPPCVFLTYYHTPIGVVKDRQIELFPENSFMIQALRDKRIPVQESSANG